MMMPSRNAHELSDAIPIATERLQKDYVVSKHFAARLAILNFEVSCLRRSRLWNVALATGDGRGHWASVLCEDHCP